MSSPLRNTSIRDRLITSYEPRKYHYARKNQYAEQFALRGHNDIAQQLEDCQETEVLAACTNCGKSWYIVNKCRLRVCPLCSYEVAKRRGEYLIAMTAKMTHPKLITLTMPLWTQDPQVGIRFLRTSFNKLRKTKFFSVVKGGAYQIELKPKDGGWHIHIHALLDAPYLPYQRLFSTWKNILGTNAPQVDIRSADTRKAREYAAKYAAKSADFYSHPETVVLWYEATKGQRLFATFGKWYNAKLEELTGEPEQPIPKAKCPNCDAESSVYLARDGPWIYGSAEWMRLTNIVVGEQALTLTIHEIRDPLTTYRSQLEAKRIEKENRKDAES